jgi:hypothetical protein
MWLAGYQQHVIAAHLHPTLFLQSQRLGVFYPMFAFYGGTLFALTGALAVVLGGSTILAFEAVILAAMAAAYGGLFWLARQLGVKGAMGHHPRRTPLAGGARSTSGVFFAVSVAIHPRLLSATRGVRLGGLRRARVAGDPIMCG